MIEIAEAPLSCSPRDGVELWFADLENVAALLDAREAEVPSLSQSERAQSAAITSGARDRDLWRLSHIALRIVLERWAGTGIRQVPYVIGARGKPALPGERPPFSLAHSGAAVLIGVTSAGSIGVDMEALREVKMTDERAAKLIAAGEALNPGQPLPAGPGPRRTLQAWVRFEAVAKVTGGGIGPNLASLRSAAAMPGPEGGAQGASHEIDVRDLAAPDGYVAAFAGSNTRGTTGFYAFPSTAETLAAVFPPGPAVGR